MTGVLLFVFGTIIGSFINAFLYRYEVKKSISGRSFCPTCKHKLAWYDLIPIFSWFLLNKRCRYCKAQISFQYPLVEFLTGIVFFLTGYSRKINDTFLLEGLTPENIQKLVFLLFALAIFSILIVISIYDFKHKEIPNGFNLTLIAVALMRLFYEAAVTGKPGLLLSNLIAALVAFLFFFSFVYFSQETWMGGGDAKLAFGLGLFLGPIYTFLAILLASVIGSIYGLSLMGLKVAGNKTEIPFGPFLALGSFISFTFGYFLIDSYVKIFLGI